MRTQVRVPKVVILGQDGIVRTRSTRKNAASPRYAPLLQDVFLLEGREALRLVGMRWFQGFVVKEV
jgi:hypothetical protein